MTHTAHTERAHREDGLFGLLPIPQAIIPGRVQDGVSSILACCISGIVSIVAVRIADDLKALGLELIVPRLQQFDDLKNKGRFSVEIPISLQLRIDMRSPAKMGEMIREALPKRTAPIVSTIIDRITNSIDTKAFGPLSFLHSGILRLAARCRVPIVQRIGGHLACVSKFLCGYWHKQVVPPVVILQVLARLDRLNKLLQRLLCDTQRRANAHSLQLALSNPIVDRLLGYLQASCNLGYRQILLFHVRPFLIETTLSNITPLYGIDKCKSIPYNHIHRIQRDITMRYEDTPMRANHRNTVQEPRIVCQREGYTIKRVGQNDFDLYVYNTYIGSFPRQDEAERAGDAAVWELLKARAA